MQYRSLADLARGERGVVVGLTDDGAQLGDVATATIARRLREIGFVPGTAFEVLERMWPGGEPIAVRIAGATFALRRAEAENVRVQVDSGARR
ncbi:MAG: ferrous iron transport protein A [Steroidobacteraceae bacterium]|nr:ferrous iron transport protein A [Steroidobacteraceae bacterium]MDW8260355.1 FeoA family protein [Gammaproteobacteria bacterium]